ncbi:MAG: aminoacyl-histidine dipeptidase [Bacteroidales bacterium]|nr:aminoacyl-histidine dipeptidase [Bacteroidales bacterium]
MKAQRVLDIFKEITTIPRESGHEGPMTAWLLDWAASHGLEGKRDATGNVLITREAAPGREKVPAVVLQAHQDMVCEKVAGSSHNFRKDPIRYEIEDGWMIAKETTLGADDGIGIAACLALLEDGAPTGKVECLFTISEETGMDGAEALEPGFFTGKTLINLDSEDEGQLFIGCAGGLNTNIKFTVRRDSGVRGAKHVLLSIGGGIGGHSGDDINKGRANAVQLMARFLYSQLGPTFRLVSIDGGGKPNAIARECSAVVAVPDPDAIAKAFAAYGADIREEFHATDPALQFSSEPAQKKLQSMSRPATERVVKALFTSPHGVQAMSQDIPGLVQTSTNMASVRTHVREGKVEVVTSQRSSATSERRAIAAKVRACFEGYGARVRHMYEYPGWNPDVNSPILARCVEAYRRLFSQEPEVKAIHAGLECGLFLQKFPGLDMISFGPTLRGVHAPGEKLELATLDKFVDLLDDVVRNMK